MKIKLLVFSLLCSFVGWGQASLPHTRTVWDTTPTGWVDSPVDSYLTTFACSGSNGAKFDTSGDFKTLNFNSLPDQLTFVVKSNASASTSVLLVEQSIDGVVYVPVVSLTGTTGLPTTCSTKGPYVLNGTSRFLRWTFTKGSSNLTMDDVNVTAGVTSPTITATPMSLSGFTYILGSGPSAEQNFIVSGVNLTANLVLNAPTNYEISLTSGGGFGSSISLTPALGIVSATTIYVRLKSGLGLGNYNGQNIACTSSGATTQNVVCNGSVVNASTSFSRGDFAVIAVNSNILCYPGSYSAGDDEISFITFRDIQNGDSFYMTDNGYERATVGLWGDNEGLYQFVRTGGTIPAGTVITFRFLNTSPFMEYISPDNNWSFSKVAGFTGNLVMNSGGDQIIFTQGGTWNNPDSPALNNHNATYTPGEYIYGFNTNATWSSLMNSTQHSALPMGLKCFSLMPGAATDYIEYTGPTTAATKLEWIGRLNDPVNWTDRVSCAGYTSMHEGQTYTINPSGTIIAGRWTGAEDTNWFNCSNWQNLEVPTQTVNVELNSLYSTKKSAIVSTAPDASLYGNIAKCNNLTISDDSVELQASSNNKLEVYGNLLIDTAGSLDMDDSTIAADGQLYLYGNWTNDIGNAAFSEGNGTVHFTGTTPQIINNVTPEGTETFNHVVLNNNFDTSVSNDIIAKGNLTVNATKTLTITPNDFAEVTYNVVNNGAINIQDDGSLVQLDDTGTYSGSGTNSMVRVAGNVVPLKLFDYVYWSSPVASASFATIPNSRFYEWDPDVVNPVGYGQGNWIGSADPSMQLGKGYIFRVPNANATQTITFSGSLFNNAVVNKTINKGTITAPFAGVNAPITQFDDNSNLVGNPYPSAIDTQTFATNNSGVLEDGTVYLWRHLTAIAPAASPYYETFVYNYNGSDYVKHNGTASIPAGAFAGKIGAGQAFFVKMKESLGSSATLQFKNEQRSRLHNNSQFFRMGAPLTAEETPLQKSRIWLDLVNPNKTAVTQVVAYVENATNGDDFYFDSKTAYRNGFGFYSLINDIIFDIQARALPFDKKDFVPLGVQLPMNGTYAIAINQVDGIFANKNQKIYVEDKLNGTLHNLTEAPYEFVGQKGIFNDRFVLRYVDKNKQQIATVATTNGVNVNTTSNEGIKITSNGLKMVNYEIYNVLGQSLAIKNSVNANEVTETSIQKNNQTLLIKVQLEDGQTLIKKIIF